MSASTSNSIEATNRFMYPKKRRRSGSCDMYPTAKMWISDPTPVVSSTKQMDNWSSCRPTGTLKRATWIQVNRVSTLLRSLAG